MSDNGDGAEAVFDQPGIVGARRFIAEYNFRLEGILTTIRIWVYAGVLGDWVEADQDYYLQTPGMKEPAVPESPRYENTEQALREIVACFTENYEKALQAGHEPNSDWLMPAY